MHAGAFEGELEEEGGLVFLLFLHPLAQWYQVHLKYNFLFCHFSVELIFIYVAVQVCEMLMPRGREEEENKDV